ncbi:MAG TPA: DUF4276 family protein [Planctomycetota bacterium]
MTKLLVVVEGDSEERFVNSTLRPHLPARLRTRAIKVQTGWTPDGKPARGGGDWTKWLKQIRLLLRPGELDLAVTTMFDLYGLPPNFPGVEAAPQHKSTSSFADALEAAMKKVVADPRFVPNIIRHEFETLVLAAMPQLDEQLNPDQRERLRPLRRALAKAAPEDINCGPETSPSKRLQRLRSYGKLAHGVPAVHAAGIARVRVSCPRFSSWISKLEKL